MTISVLLDIIVLVSTKVQKMLDYITGIKN